VEDTVQDRIADLRRELAGTNACYGCDQPITETQVLVLADSLGDEGPAVDPHHLNCYLQTMEWSLPSNKPIVDHVKREATAILERGFEAYYPEES
jgi:hypothetical protein